VLNSLDSKKIFILSSTSGIGDMIMAIPMLKLLHEKIPEAEITLCVLQEGTKQIFETCPFIKKTIKLETKNLLSKVQRDQEFDLCIATCDTSGYISTGMDSILARYIKAKRRIGFSLPMSKILPFKFQLPQLLLDDTVTVDFSKHCVVQNVEMLKLLGISSDDGMPELELWLTVEDMAAADRFMMEHNIQSGDMLIGIHPGGQKRRGRWSKENFAALIDSLHGEYRNARILLFGGPDEEELKNDVATLVKGAKPIIVTTSLRKTAALIKHCNLFIGSDSALTHVASAVKTPVAVIFGPANPLATGPYSKKSTVVTCQFDCQPCSYNRVSIQIEVIYAMRLICKRNPYYACLIQLPVSEVLKAATSLMESKK
jgi:ADP-heptose:LPS heptosyltransferase